MSAYYSLGLDFGTSNTCLCYATFEKDNDGKMGSEPRHRPEAVLFSHQTTVPSVVFLGSGDEEPPLYGQLAEERVAIYPKQTRQGFKLFLGAPGSLGEEAYDLARQFLAFLRDRAAEIVPLDRQRVDVETVIGHPVQWSPDQRELTRRVAEEAGFPNVRLEDESIAALYSHLCDDRVGGRPEPGGRVLMIDMGGGTTDFAFLEIPRNEKQRPVSTPVDVRQEVAAWGDGQTSYGGRDVDRLLLDHLSRDWDSEAVALCRPWLMREVRRFKEHFSNGCREGDGEYATMWLVDDRPRRVELDRATFERVAGDYIAHFPRLVRAALAAMDVAPRQVSHVLLTGGHSRWYWVDGCLADIFPHVTNENGRLLRHPEPEQSVARGLAYSPWVRANASKVLAPERRAAHSIWLSVPDGVAEEQRELTVAAGDTVLVIKRGQTLPFRQSSPVRFRVRKIDFNAKEATVRLKLHLGSQTSTQAPLYDRVTTFERGFWESAVRSLWTTLPTLFSPQQDEFDVLVLSRVDENELLHAEVAVTRYRGGHAVETQRQRVQLESTATRRMSELVGAAASPPRWMAMPPPP